MKKTSTAIKQDPFVVTLKITPECAEKVSADDLYEWIAEKFATSDLGAVQITSIKKDK